MCRLREELCESLCSLYSDRVSAQMYFLDRDGDILEVGLDVSSGVELETLSLKGEYFRHGSGS